MAKKILIFVFLLVVFFGVASFNLTSVYGAGEYTFPETNLPDPAGGIADILTNLLNWLLGIVGVIAIIAFLISGIQFMASTGDPSTIETAKKNALYSVIGLIIALSGYIVIKAVTNFLNAQPF